MRGRRTLGANRTLAILEAIALFAALSLGLTGISLIGPVELFGPALITALALLALAPPLLAVWRARGTLNGPATLLVGALVGLLGALLSAAGNAMLLYVLSDLPSSRMPAPGLVAGWLSTLFLVGSPLAALVTALVAAGGAAVWGRRRTARPHGIRSGAPAERGQRRR